MNLIREILFRGKRKDNGKWVEGYYGQFHNRPIHKGENSHQIFVLMEDATGFGSMIGGLWHEVIPETVGKYTGLTDKNGKKIFEGDIVIFPWGEKREVFSVEFVEGEFEAIPKRKSTDIWCIRIGSYAPEFEVIGNIHDNPELLKGGDSE